MYRDNIATDIIQYILEDTFLDTIIVYCGILNY